MLTVGWSLVDLIGELVYVRLLTQVADLFGGQSYFYVQVTRDVLKQSQHRGHFTLRQEIDLQVEVCTFVRLVRQAILTGQYEQREKDRLERDDRGQQRKRKWIERLNVSNDLRVDRDPNPKPRDMRELHRSTARQARDPVAQPFSCGPTVEGRLLPALNRLDVFIDRW